MLQPHGLLFCAMAVTPDPLHGFGSGDGVSNRPARGGDSGGWLAAGTCLLGDSAGDSVGASLMETVLCSRPWCGTASGLGGRGGAAAPPAAGKSDCCNSFCQEQPALPGTTAPLRFHFVLCALDMLLLFCAVGRGSSEGLFYKTKDCQTLADVASSA